MIYVHKFWQVKWAAIALETKETGTTLVPFYLCSLVSEKISYSPQSAYAKLVLARTVASTLEFFKIAVTSLSELVTQILKFYFMIPQFVNILF